MMLKYIVTQYTLCHDHVVGLTSHKTHRNYGSLLDITNVYERSSFMRIISNQFFIDYF